MLVRRVAGKKVALLLRCQLHDKQLALAVAYCTGARYLLLDEPMNALDLGNVALIGRGETYGYELVGALAACGLPGIAEGTLYPLLMRLEKKGFIASTYRESEVGPRRKYYRITETGAAEVTSFAEEFASLSTVVERALEGFQADASNEPGMPEAGDCSEKEDHHA